MGEMQDLFIYFYILLCLCKLYLKLTIFHALFKPYTYTPN